MAHKKRFKDIAFIAFDADDTLWENETKFRKAEKAYIEILSHYVPENIIMKEQLTTEMQNLPIYGYGSKSFCLALIETALRITEHKIKTEEISKIYELGKSLLKHPIKVFDDVEKTLNKLTKKYSMSIITKGDLLEQESKLFASGLMDKFDFIEIVREKDEAYYKKLLEKYEVEPHQFMMVGNSPKSDILPVLKIGAYATYIPCELTWTHEMLDEKEFNHYNKFTQLNNFAELSEILL